MNMQDRDLMLAALRKVWLTKTSISVPCESEGQAKALRLSFYRAAAPFRKDGAIDPELTKAIEGITLSVTKDGVLEIRPGLSKAAYQQLAAALNITEADLKSPENRAADRLLQELGGATASADEQFGAPNKYYTRELPK